MATLPVGTYTQATQNIPASPGVTLGRFFGVGSLAPLQPALYCSTVQSQPRGALLGPRRTLLGLQRAVLGLQRAALGLERAVLGLHRAVPRSVYT